LDVADGATSWPGDRGRISGGAYAGLQANAALIMEGDWLLTKRLSVKSFVGQLVCALVVQPHLPHREQGFPFDRHLRRSPSLWLVGLGVRGLVTAFFFWDRWPFDVDGARGKQETNPKRRQVPALQGASAAAPRTSVLK